MNGSRFRDVNQSGDPTAPPFWASVVHCVVPSTKPRYSARGSSLKHFQARAFKKVRRAVGGAMLLVSMMVDKLVEKLIDQMMLGTDGYSVFWGSPPTMRV